jgi:CheY-like chemotaxis protein
MTRVLLVDDSASVLRILQFVFESSGYEVVTAVDGGDALQKIAEHPPHIVVTDSIMPVMDGPALLRALKARDATRAIPVVMLTSEDSGPPVLSDIHPDALLQKSSDFEPLLNKVKKLVGPR